MITDAFVPPHKRILGCVVVHVAHRRNEMHGVQMHGGRSKCAGGRPTVRGRVSNCARECEAGPNVRGRGGPSARGGGVQVHVGEVQKCWAGPECGEMD